MTKNVTLSADEKLIEKARERARSEHRSLNTAFRDWLYRYAHGGADSERYQRLMERLSYAEAGRKFTREELNER